MLTLLKRNSQKISLAILCSGGGFFLWRMSELLQKHADGWGYFGTPAGVGDIAAIFGAVLTMVGGALGVTLKKEQA